jgi:hypothetical protein
VTVSRCSVTQFPQNPFMGRDNLPAQKSPLASPGLSFAGLRFHGLSCGKFPISMWLGAQGARMQFTSFLGRRTTSRTRHGEYLFQREFLGFHYHMMQRSTAGKCPILLIFNTLAQRQVSLGPPAVFTNSEQK